MSQPVTEEMISLYLDGKLSAEDQATVENTLSTDENLRKTWESYRQSASAIKASAAWVSKTAALPTDFTSQVMAQINTLELQETQPEPRVLKDTTARTASTRTWIEVVAATVAIVIIAISWSSQTTRIEQVASPESSSAEHQKTKNGVHMLGSRRGEFKKPDLQTKTDSPRLANAASREFSIFASSKARPQIDRFWIINDYEVTAPKNTDPGGASEKINVLLIDAKKKDAVQFLSQLSKWDAHFQVFQQTKTGNASWLAPFDTSKAGKTEGDVWTLQIVLIDP
ncbi:MAG: hypothetical protein VX438_18445 [Planctomycetota bacterium]|nr:hypothetical protein [Planctomycetota bacterium]